MLNYAVYLKMRQKLNSITALTEKLKGASGVFYAAVVEYLKDLLSFAEEINFYLAPDIALEIDKLLTYDGEKSNQSSMVKKNVRKEKDAYAVNRLDNIYGEIKKFIEKDRSTYEECRDLWRQVLARAANKGSVNLSADSTEKIIFVVKNDAELLPYYSHIMGLAGSFNCSILLESVLQELRYDR